MVVEFSWGLNEVGWLVGMVGRQAGGYLEILDMYLLYELTDMFKRT